VTSRCTVEENGKRRTFMVTLEPATGSTTTTQAAASSFPAATNGTPVHSSFGGTVEIVDIMVKKGDRVTKGQVVASVEAMKAQHDIRTPCDGQVTEIYAKIGDEVDSSKPILMIS
jgi:biotin carboxyl carrier protein